MSKDYFDISKMTNDEETRTISKTGSGVLVYGSEETNTNAVESVRWTKPTTKGNPTAVHVDVPTTTSVDAAVQIITVKVEAPLIYVSGHIIQPIAIRFLLTDTMGITSTVVAVPTHFI